MFQNVGMKESLVDRVVNEIERRVLDGVLAPGMMLPPERELCEQLGVSRTALREAVRVLVSKGLIETRPGVGTIISQISSNHVSGSLQFVLNRMGGVSLEQLNQVRQILEVEIARLAAEKATEQDVQKLTVIYNSSVAARHTPDVLVDGDFEFHRTLAEMTRNPVLAILLDTINDMMHDVRKRLTDSDELPDVVIVGHARILQEVASRDPAGSSKAMQDHLTEALLLQKKHLEKVGTLNLKTNLGERNTPESVGE